jgi:hypothetical protein
MFETKDSRGSIMKISTTFLGMVAAAGLLCLAPVQNTARAEGSMGAVKGIEQGSLITKIQHSKRESRRERDRDEEEHRNCKDSVEVVGEGRYLRAKSNAEKLWRSTVTDKYGEQFADWQYAKNKSVSCVKSGDLGWKRKCTVRALPCKPRAERSN